MHIQITTTCDNKNVMESIAESLVKKKLAACAQISGPIASHYRWQGKLERSEEWMCIIKTRSDRYEAVESTIRELHSYDEPEIIGTEIVKGSQGYLHWIDEMVDRE